MRIKNFVITTVLATVIFCSAGFVSAQTTDNSALIAQLQAQIASLMAQIKAMQAQQGGTTQSWCHTFNTYLVAGSMDTTTSVATSGEVTQLETALTKEGLDVSGDTPGIFGDNTAAAVVQFQGKYGIKQTGTVGPLTRTKLNSLYGCGTNSNPPVPLPIPVACTPNWTCTWGPCISGYQSQVSVDSNNCGVTTGNKVACPSLAQTCGQTNQCANLYWFDNTYQGCASQKQFCGSYMYQGLQTFSTQLLCQTAILQKQLNKTCNTNSDCLSGQVCNSGLCGTAQTIGSLIPSTTFVNYNLIQGRSAQPTQIILTNASSLPVNYTISVPNQPAWLNSSYNTQQMSLQAGGVMGIGTSVDSTKVSGPGTYTANIVVTGNFSNSPISIPVTLTVTAQASQPVSVTSPNGGETFTAGQTYQIRWNAPNDSASQNMQITLANGDAGEVAKIGNSCIEQGVVAPVPSADPNARYLQANCSGITNIPVLNTGSYTWTIPTTLPAGSHYYIYVGESKIMGDGDFSNSAFTINVAQPVAQPSITVTSPSGGETWTQGETHNITWTSSNLPTSSVVNVKLFTTCSGTPAQAVAWSYNGTLASNISASVGSYSWTIPTNIPACTNSYKIQVITSDGITSGLSSNYFSIANPQVTATPTGVSISAGAYMGTMSQGPIVTVPAGTTLVNINWTSTGATSCNIVGSPVGVGNGTNLPPFNSSGNTFVVDARNNNTYTVTCSNSVGSATNSVTVNIAAQ